MQGFHFYFSACQNTWPFACCLCLKCFLFPLKSNRRQEKHNFFKNIYVFLLGNRLTVVNVRGTEGNKPHDSGAYRCLATNKFGSVFLEKEIKIRVMGTFNAGNADNKPASLLKPTVNKNFKIPCPPHSRSDGYGLTYEWGYVPTGQNTPRYWRPGNPNPRVYIDYGNGDLWYSYVAKDDIKESRDIQGLRCIMANHRTTVLSNQQLFWTEIKSNSFLFSYSQLFATLYIYNDVFSKVKFNFFLHISWTKLLYVSEIFKVIFWLLDYKKLCTQYYYIRTIIFKTKLLFLIIQLKKVSNRNLILLSICHRKWQLLLILLSQCFVEPTESKDNVFNFNCEVLNAYQNKITKVCKKNHWRKDIQSKIILIFLT